MKEQKKQNNKNWCNNAPHAEILEQAKPLLEEKELN